MKKINYIETEEKLCGSDHGFEFHYRPLTYIQDKYRRGEPVAILLLDGWYRKDSKPIRVLIHPVSSPKLKDMGEKPEVIITEVKEAIEHFLRVRPKLDVDQFHINEHVTEHVTIWVNG
jgi:hypothetical protein